MNRRFETVLFTGLMGCAITACSGGGGTLGPSSVSPPVLPTAAGVSPSTAQGFTYDASALAGATYIGTAKVASISVDLVPAMQNAAGLLQYAGQANDPKNANYRHFLTPLQIGDRFGASANAYAGAVKYFQSQGLSVATWPQRLLLHVTGPQTKMEGALHTTFGWYQKNARVFLAPRGTPAPPASLKIAGAANIVMYPVAFTDYAKAAQSATNGILYGYSPQQIATVFDYNGAYAAGYTGTGITTGVIGTAGIDAYDVPVFRSMYHVSGSGTVTVVDATDANAPGNAALGFATPLPINPACLGAGSPYEPTLACNPEDVETQLDTEQLSTLAPNANLRYYLAYNPNDGCGEVGVDCPPGAGVPEQGLYEFNAEIETAIADDQADVLSMSFGGAEAAMVGAEFNAAGTGITPLEIAALASEGVAVFVSSGDSGAEECQTWTSAPNPDALCVSYPATDPNVVAVGGVNTPLNSAGELVGGITGWGYRTSGGNYGSGGGVSAYFLQPPAQQGAAGVIGTMRNVPDIALDGDVQTGVSVLLYGDPQFAGQPEYHVVTPVGGTSVAAPEAAAMWALVLQACKQSASCARATGPVPYRLGNPNAYFYKIYENASAYATVFDDVLYGENSETCLGTSTPCPGPTDAGYSDGVGYDLVTGIGVPYANALIEAVVGK